MAPSSNILGGGGGRDGGAMSIFYSSYHVSPLHIESEYRFVMFNMTSTHVQDHRNDETHII